MILTPVQINDIAEKCHEANRQFAIAINDGSLLPWDKLTREQKEASLNGVLTICSGEVRSPEESHQIWMDKKLADGWKYGPEKSEINKTHPHLCPYEKLDNLVKAKDFIFYSVCIYHLNVLKRKAEESNTKERKVKPFETKF